MGDFSSLSSHTKIRKNTHIYNFIKLINVLIINNIVKLCNKYLSPKLMQNHNIMYSYDLKRCLNEHLYTKFVRMLPDKKSDLISDEEYDHVTLRFALQRLETKQKYIDLQTDKCEYDVSSNF